MSGARSALIVATYQYDDPRLSMLRAPERDAEALAEVLGDAAIGGFDVRTVVNQPAHVISVEVAEFFAHRHVGDVLLVHFSCHGVKDDSGDLFLAATDTRMDLLEATAVSSGYVNRAMTRSRSGCVVLLLDCCYAGAFARGMTRAGSDVDVTDRFGGRGRAVITASTALQFAFEGTELSAGDLVEPGPSVFTRALVDGLRSGEADRNSDGIVSLDELYAHVHDEVTRANPDQTPQKWLFDVAGDLHVARRATPVTRPSELPGPLVESIDSLLAWERESTIAPLQTLLLGSHPGRALAARIALERLAGTDEDSARVRHAAQAALGLDGETAPTPGPDETGELDQGKAPAPPPTVVTGQTVASRRPRRGLLVVAAVVAIAVVGGIAVRAWVSRAGSNSTAVSIPPIPNDQTMLVPVNGIPTTFDVETKRVAPGSGTISIASVSPHAQYVTYIVPSGDSARGSPVVIGPDGTRQPLLTGSAARECATTGRPSWGPGGQIAFQCFDQQGKWLGVRITAFVDRTQLAQGPADACTCGLTWAGNDQIVYGARDPRGGSTLKVWTMSTGMSRVLTRNPGTWDNAPDWTTTPGAGAKVLFVRSTGRNAAGSLCVVQVPATLIRPTQAQCALSNVVWPTWSPDGSRIAYVLQQTQKTSLRVTSDPQSAGAKMPIEGDIGPPAWGSR
jgi:hypothetical protein